MLGLPRPNCHSHGLTSYKLLPLRPSAAVASAFPNWNAPLPFQLCVVLTVDVHVIEVGPYCGLMVTMEVSATTVAIQFARQLQNSLRPAFFISGLPFE